MRPTTAAGASQTFKTPYRNYAQNIAHFARVSRVSISAIPCASSSPHCCTRRSGISTVPAMPTLAEGDVCDREDNEDGKEEEKPNQEN